MLKMVLFICFLPFAIMEMYYYHQFGLIVVGSLYILLTLQADASARRFVLNGLRWPVQTAQARKRDRLREEEELKVAPLWENSDKKEDTGWTAMRPDPIREERPIETPRLSRPSPFRETARRQEQEPPRKKELPKAPNFHGNAHEVLAVPESAATRTIKHAFRMLIKQVHPDHNRGLPASLANQRVQRITEAKELLLERRRAKKAA